MSTTHDDLTAGPDIAPIEPAPAPPTRQPAPRSPRHIVFFMLGAGVVATTLLAIGAVVADDFSSGMGKAIGSTMAMFGYGLLALIGTYRYERRPSPRLAYVSVLTACAGLATAVLSIWAGNSDNLVKLAWVGFIVAFAISHASVLQARRRPVDPRSVALLVSATQVLIALAAALLCVLVIMIEDVGEGFARALVTVLLIDVMLNVLVPIVRRTIRPRAESISAEYDAPSMDVPS